MSKVKEVKEPLLRAKFIIIKKKVEFERETVRFLRAGKDKTREIGLLSDNYMLSRH